MIPKQPDNDATKFMRNNGYRFTRGRKALLEILKNEHLTFRQIQERLAEKGYKNVSSIYNMLEFFLENKLITIVFVNGVKYYDLAIGNNMHQDESYIHMVILDTNDIFEISNKTLYDRIKEVTERDYNVDIDYIKIIIGARKK